MRKPERGRFLREFGHVTCSLHAGLRREAETQREFCSSLRPAELRLVALWTVVRPKTVAAPLLEGELEIMPEQGPLEPRDSESMARVVCPFGVCAFRIESCSAGASDCFRGA